MVLKKRWLACCAYHGVCSKVKETGVFFLFLITYGEVPHSRDEKQTGGVLLSTSDC